MKSIFLYPGQIAFSREPAEITTMLGSCVAIALYDPVEKLGGLNHYLLAEPHPGEQGSCRYGTYAIQSLIDGIESIGGKRSRLVAKVYGGANVLKDVQMSMRIGDRNIEVARRELNERGIKIVEEATGGTRGRRVKLTTDSFEVSHVLVGHEKESPNLLDRPSLPKKAACKVLIVDDSASVRNIFRKIFDKAGLEVVGVASNAYEARELLVSKKPDVITLDIEMPQMNGVNFLEKVMKFSPTPVVMVSSLEAEGQAALKSLELGAIEFVHKPTQFDPEGLRDLAESLVQKVKAASLVGDLKTRPKLQKLRFDTNSAPTMRRASGASVECVLVGGNTGSPKSLETLVKSWQADSPPVVVAISTVGDFLESYLDRLRAMSKNQINFKIATEGTPLYKGDFYFIPAGKHAQVVGDSSQWRIKLISGHPHLGQIPSSDILFSGSAESLKASAAAILLSGFGKDGVKGLERVQSLGGMTLVEDPADATFPYAPQAAIEEGVVMQVSSAEEMFEVLKKLRSVRAA